MSAIKTKEDLIHHLAISPIEDIIRGEPHIIITLEKQVASGDERRIVSDPVEYEEEYLTYDEADVIYSPVRNDLYEMLFHPRDGISPWKPKSGCDFVRIVYTLDFGWEKTMLRVTNYHGIHQMMETTHRVPYESRDSVLFAVNNYWRREGFSFVVRYP